MDSLLGINEGAVQPMGYITHQIRGTTHSVLRMASSVFSISVLFPQ